MGKKPGPGRQVEISDSIELCIVELTRVDCTVQSYFGVKTSRFCHNVINVLMDVII